MTEIEDSDQPTQLRFGVFIPPLHDPRGNPTLQLERELEIIELVDHLGFDEAWVGEHLSNGFETITCPEMFLAAAAGRTKRIRLGTGVNSLPYHHPFTLANRIVLLDHLSRGRAMMGIGPGQSVNDAAMMGIDHRDARDMMVEATEVILSLLRGETVTRETSWFKLRDARVQLGPYNPDGIDIAVASVFSPTGSTLAGRLGIGMLSLAASDLAGFESLDSSWANLQRHASESGHIVERSRWRVLGAMHLAESVERARSDMLAHIISSVVTFPSLASGDETWATDPEAALEKWTTEGIGPFGGVATVGTPDDAVAGITRLVEKSGGFGTYLLYVHHAAAWDATRRSLELFAEYVIPELNRMNGLRQASIEWLHLHSAQFQGERRAAVEEAREKYGAREPATGVPSWGL